MNKIIIDTDIGVDDAVALRYGLLTHEVLGFCCTYGNVAVGQAVKNARLLCRHYGARVPVLRGASRPLSRTPLKIESYIHGRDGLGEAYDNDLPESAPDAVAFIIEMAEKYPGEVTLCTIGPLTNLAMALNLRPDLPSLLKEVVCMGGAFGTAGHGGNMTQFAEFNVLNDPEACDLVFASDLNLTVVPLDVTLEVLVTAEEIASLNDPFLKAITAFYLDFSRKHKGYPGMAVHDALTISYLLHPEFYEALETPLAVQCGGLTDGQTLRPVTLNVPLDKFESRSKHRVLLGVDADAVRRDLLETLTFRG